MDRREVLQELLEMLLGSEHVYYQPPANVKMRYPAIVYERDRVATEFASNHPYRRTKRYQVTVIDREPDNPIADKIGELPLSSFSRHFVANNLHHDIYSLYF